MGTLSLIAYQERDHEMQHSPDYLHQVRSARYVSDMYKIGRWFLYIVGVGFGAAFTVLQIRQITFVPLINSADGHSLTRVALILYYYAWIGGSRIEFNLSEKVYVADPERGSFAKIGGLVFGVLVLGVVLCIVAYNEKYVSGALAVFYILDVVLWIFVKRRAKSMALASAEIYRTRHLHGKIEQLRCYATRYIRGSWQYLRYLAKALVLIAILMLTYADVVRSSVAEMLSSVIAGVSSQTFFTLLPGAVILFYILLGEIWTWHMRVKTKRDIEFLDYLEWGYKIVPHTPSDIVAPSV
jgi:hypothetical protein